MLLASRPVHAPRQSSQRASGLRVVASGFGWFLLVLASLAGTIVAAWVLLSLSRTTQDHSSSGLHAAWSWLLVLAVCVGAPTFLAWWRYRERASGWVGALSWIPLVWNGCGLLLASQVIPDLTAVALRRHGAWILLERSDDTGAGIRVLSALGHNAADWVDPASVEQEVRLPAQKPRPQVEQNQDALTISFAAEGNAILTKIELEGPAGKMEMPYLFDTGASFTTISSATAARLGIDVPEDAPTLKFNTASGPRESPMVYLPALTLGPVRLTGLLVSVCDGCTNERTEGLLGLNVMREFFVQLDYQAEHMRLIPRSRKSTRNRAYDVTPVVTLDLDGRPEIWLGRVRWVVTVENRGTEPLTQVVPQVVFSDGQILKGKPIPTIEPGSVGRSLVEGRRAHKEGEALSFTLKLAEARW